MGRTKDLIKKIIAIVPGGNTVFERLIRPRRSINSSQAGTDIKELFTNYYMHNSWGNKESVSGAGSTLEYTENLRREMPPLLEQYKVRKFLDAPCGDYNWFQAVQKPREMRYIGADIVNVMIEQNQKQFGDQSTSFIQLDITTDVLPKADMWMCRDCLFHFSYEDIFRTLANFFRSDIEYLFTSVHTECTKNADIATGGARQLNLELPPFSFCKPLLYIDDWVSGFPVRRMGLWTRSMVEESVASSPMLLGIKS